MYDLNKFEVYAYLKIWSEGRNPFVSYWNNFFSVLPIYLGREMWNYLEVLKTQLIKCFSILNNVNYFYHYFQTLEPVLFSFKQLEMCEKCIYTT